MKCMFTERVAINSCLNLKKKKLKWKAGMPVFKTNWFQLTLAKLAILAKLVLKNKMASSFSWE